MQPGRKHARASATGGHVAARTLTRTEIARALQLVARWAAAEQGASTVGDLLTLAPGITELPTDVARSWDRIGHVKLQTLTGTALPGHDLPRLAGRLLDEVADDRRRLILTCRTFAPQRRTYDSLAAELGVSRERVRQLENQRWSSWPRPPWTICTPRCGGARRPQDAPTPGRRPKYPVLCPG